MKRKITQMDMITKQREIILIQSRLLDAYKKHTDKSEDRHMKSIFKIFGQWEKEIEMHPTFARIGMITGIALSGIIVGVALIIMRHIC